MKINYGGIAGSPVGSKQLTITYRLFGKTRHIMAGKDTHFKFLNECKLVPASQHVPRFFTATLGKFYLFVDL